MPSATWDRPRVRVLECLSLRPFLPLAVLFLGGGVFWLFTVRERKSHLVRYAQKP
jgi:hypothetical protein